MMTACLLWVTLLGNEKPTYKDTSELVGIISQWPSGNVLVFEDQYVQFESTSIDSIKEWDAHHVTVKDVFGSSFTIDIRKVPLAKTNLWSDSPTVTKGMGFYMPGKVSLHKPHTLVSAKPTSQIELGVGKSSLTCRFFTSSFDPRQNVTHFNQAISQASSQNKPIQITVKGECEPVFISDARHYVYIKGENARFGSAYVCGDKGTKKLIDNAMWFLPLRLKVKESN